MNDCQIRRTADGFVPWLRRVIASFAAGLFSGGVCVPAVHFLVYGDVDPFTHGWPLCLEASALLLTMIMGLLVHSPTALALGVYAGLAGLMLASGGSEYPISSLIGLAIHGFVPAAFGSAVSFLIFRVIQLRVLRVSQMPGEIRVANASGGPGEVSHRSRLQAQTDRLQ